jgi:hypothetical protein
MLTKKIRMYTDCSSYNECHYDEGHFAIMLCNIMLGALVLSVVKLSDIMLRAFV